MRNNKVLFLLSVLVGILFSHPTTVHGAEQLNPNVEYLLVKLDNEAGSIIDNSGWDRCGKYFASLESPAVNYIFFIVTEPGSEIPKFVFGENGLIDPVLNEKVLFPTIMLWIDNGKERFRIRLNLEDYLAATCIAKRGSGV